MEDTAGQSKFGFSWNHYRKSKAGMTTAQAERINPLTTRLTKPIERNNDMIVEIVRPDILSNDWDTFTEIATNVYQRDDDKAILVIGPDQAVLISNPVFQPWDITKEFSGDIPEADR